VVVGESWEFFCGVAHDLLADQLLHGALDGHVLALRGGEVAAHGLSEALAPVLPRAVDEERVEEDDVALLHGQVDPVVLELLVLLDAEVGLVDLAVVGVVVLVEAPLVSPGQDVQAAVLRIAVLERRPRSHYPVSRSEGEIGEILVEGMPGARAHSRRLVDEHGVHRFDVVAAEAPEVGDEVGIGAVALQHFVELEVLQLGDVGLAGQLPVPVLLHQRNIPHDLHAGQPA